MSPAKFLFDQDFAAASKAKPSIPLEQHEALRAVLEFRERLQLTWTEAYVNPGNAVVQLREWCAQADASGIRGLREFAQRLRTYLPARASLKA